MNLLRLASLAVGSLSAMAVAAALLVASSAHAQQPPPPGAPANVSGTATIVVTPPPPAGYLPVQVIEVPQVYGTPYPYQQQAPNLRVGQLQAELLNVEAQYAQYSLGGSIALIAVGGATTGIAGATFMLFGLVSTLGSDDDGVQRGLIISGVLTLVGIVMLVGGIVMMVGRISERRPYGRRIKEIKQELANNYGVRASLDVVPLPAGGMLTGSLTF